MVVDFLSMFLLAYYIAVQPMTDRVNNWMQIFNELLVLCAIDSLFFFTDFVSDPKLRY